MKKDLDMNREDLVNAWQLLSNGENEEARAKFAEALAVNPEDTEALMGLGKALARLKRYDEALETFRIVLTLDPNHAEAHHNAAWILYYRMKQWREAEIHVQRALVSAPDVAKYHLLAAECARRRGDWRAVRAHLEAAERIAPDTLDRRMRWFLTFLRIDTVVDKLFTPVIGCVVVLVSMYACCLLMAGQEWGVKVGVLPFGLASVVYALERRYRLAIGAAVLGILWIVLALLFIAWRSAR